MSKLTFHPDVSLEIKASYDWYQEKINGLGEDFIYRPNDSPLFF